MNESASALNGVSIVLVRPKYLENIGSAARAACTMGVGRLVVVGSKPVDLESALRTATHNAASLIHGIAYHDSIESAVAGHALVVGTTARKGRQRMVMAQPADLGSIVIPALGKGPVAMVFGPEDTGLSNLELALCGLVVTIPTASQFSSINLAQAVMIVCYELYQGVERLAGQVGGHRLYQPRTASMQEISSMINVAAQAFHALDQGSSRKKADLRLRHLRQAASRYPFSAREIKIIKDTCHQLAERLERSGGDER